MTKEQAIKLLADYAIEHLLYDVNLSKKEAHDLALAANMLIAKYDFRVDEIKREGVDYKIRCTNALAPKTPGGK